MTLNASENSANRSRRSVSERDDKSGGGKKFAMRALDPNRRDQKSKFDAKLMNSR
jgi:hypothetical protein